MTEKIKDFERKKDGRGKLRSAPAVRQRRIPCKELIRYLVAGARVESNAP